MWCVCERDRQTEQSETNTEKQRDSRQRQTETGRKTVGMFTCAGVSGRVLCSQCRCCCCVRVLYPTCWASSKLRPGSAYLILSKSSSRVEASRMEAVEAARGTESRVRNAKSAVKDAMRTEGNEKRLESSDRY